MRSLQAVDSTEKVSKGDVGPRVTEVTLAATGPLSRVVVVTDTAFSRSGPMILSRAKGGMLLDRRGC